MSRFHRRLILPCLVSITGAFCTAAAATKFFVALDGCDETHDGRARETAFATVQRGVNALAPGDTLTILPGEYLGSVHRDGLGSGEAVTTIRAEIPGTAVLRGDVPIEGFQPLEGYRFVQVTDFPGEHAIMVLNVQDTLTVLESQPNVSLLEMIPGSFHQDRAAGRLYVSMPTLQPPQAHRLSASINSGHGLYLSNAKQVVIEGLAVTGFNTNRQREGREGAHGGIYGIFLNESADCTVRDCRAWLNAQGIGISSGQQASDALRGGNVIERCTAWANASQHGWGDMGGLTIFHGRRDTIRDSVSFHNAGYGANIYNRAIGMEEADANRSRLIRNLTWGNGLADLKIKAEPWHVTERCVGTIGSNTLNPIRCLFRRRYAPAGPDSIQLDAEADLDPDAEFADPEHHDYRLQATSRFRGTGPDGIDRGPYLYAAEVFFVSAAGDDSADGRSIAGAWRSLSHALDQLPAGATLYLSAGSYALPPRIDLPAEVTLRARGHDTVRIEGASMLSGNSGLRVERLDFTDLLTLQGLRDAGFSQCSFSGAEGGLRADGVAGLRLERVLFAGVRLEATRSTELEVSGCVFTDSPGLVLDDAAEMRYADYNAYADGAHSWSVDGEGRALDALRPDHDRYSQVLTDTWELEATGAPRLRSTPAVQTGGPWNLSLGRHDIATRMTPVRRTAGPYVHSVTDTTANLEWWVSAPGEYRICWGEAPEFSQSVVIDTVSAGNFSLTGLRPDRKYRFRIGHPEPFAVESIGEMRETAEIVFRTAPEPAPPRTFHVSPGGDDAADGLSRETALRTVAQAAEQVRPGDTVLIGAGTYAESVRIRTTGEKDRPITFKAHPGEKVVFDGMERALTFAFLATDKSHLHFDGFYFTGFGHFSAHVPWAHRLQGDNGVFTIYRGNDISVSRCFSDGRGPGYGPGMLFAIHAGDIRLRNNVIISAMGGGVRFYGCPNLQIKQNVFLRSLISHIGEGVNEPNQPFVMTHNLFTDTLASKVHGSMLNIGKLESMIETSNGYYLRVPDAERQMFQFYEPEPAFGRAARAYRLRDTFDTPPLITERARLSLAEYQQQFNPESDSVVIDPLFQGTLDWERTDDAGKPVYLGDWLVARDDLDFPDLFTTHPELIERRIGLQPEAFADFHFHR